MVGGAKSITLVVLLLSRFVSDHAPAGCQALLQHRLIQANQKTQLGSGSTPETARTYPLSLLEWTANRKKANMVLQVHCFDGKMQLAFFKIFNITPRSLIFPHCQQMKGRNRYLQNVPLFIFLFTFSLYNKSQKTEKCQTCICDIM